MITCSRFLFRTLCLKYAIDCMILVEIYRNGEARDSQIRYSYLKLKYVCSSSVPDLVAVEEDSKLQTYASTKTVLCGVRKSVIRSCNNSTDQISELRRGPWTIEEDTLLIHYIASHGEGHWNNLAKYSGLKRTGKSCRLRWLNYLKPDIKRGNLSPQEQLLILELHSKWGNRWSKIAQQLPGRTDNEIKNYWRTRVEKQAKQLNIESNSQKFLETVRHLWIPRLLQKMDQKSSTTSSNYKPPSSQSFSQALQQNPCDSSSEAAIEANQSSIQSSGAYHQWPECSESISEEFGNSDLQPLNNGEFQVDQQDLFSLLGGSGVAEFDGQLAASDWVLEDDVAETESLWNLENWL